MQVCTVLVPNTVVGPRESPDQIVLSAMHRKFHPSCNDKT